MLIEFIVETTNRAMKSDSRERYSHGDLAKVANSFLARLFKGLHEATRDPQVLLLAWVPDKPEQQNIRWIVQSLLHQSRVTTNYKNEKKSNQFTMPVGRRWRTVRRPRCLPHGPPTTPSSQPPTHAPPSAPPSTPPPPPCGSPSST